MSSEITWPVTFSIEHILRDLLNTKDPVLKKVLREREDDYLNNLAWLDADLERLTREEEEKQRLYEDNLVWLDEDLKGKMDQRYKDNLAWLDEDLKEKLDQRHKDNLAWLDEDLEKKMEDRQKELLMARVAQADAEWAQAEAEWAQMEAEWAELEANLDAQHHERVTTPLRKMDLFLTHKIWHWGHGNGDSPHTTPLTKEEKKVRRARFRKQYEDGLTNGTCIIGHRFQQENEVGLNTRKQLMAFQRDAKKGDIIFNHCTQKGGLTHYGFFTGEISRRPSTAPEDAGQGWFHSFASVRRWHPLPETLKGVGRRDTLYEVTPYTKAGKPTNNYQNYSIPS